MRGIFFVAKNVFQKKRASRFAVYAKRFFIFEKFVERALSFLAQNFVGRCFELRERKAMKNRATAFKAKHADNFFFANDRKAILRIFFKKHFAQIHAF